MDKGEPSLVPEWLRNSGHASGGGSSNHHLLSSSSHSDSASLLHNSRNRNSRSKSDVDSIHSPDLDRSSSTNSRRGASNGSGKHAYSSFNYNKSQRDKDRIRDKDRVSSNVDPWDLDTSLPTRNILTGKDHDQLRRSHSMVTRKQGDHLSRGFTVGMRNGGSSNSYNGNGILPGPSISNSFQRTGFDKDFPSLGADEKHDVVRVSSPGLSAAVQSLPVGSSGLIGGEGWTSALAEVPNVIEKACAGSLTSPRANAVSTGTVTGQTGLNMAEALVQAPARTHTPPQGSVKTQRLEDLAIKQSRQLIPVVASTPKCSSFNHSDKSKPKQLVRTGETCLAPSRNAHHQPSASLVNFQSNPSGQIKPEKKLLVLKPNGAAAVKESGSPSGNTNNRAVSSQLMSVAQSTQSAPVRSTNSPKEVKGSTLSMISAQTIEKKASLAQTQSRNAFYSALKQKTTSTTNPINSTTCNSSSVEEKVDNSPKELVASDPSSPQATSGLEATERIQITSQVLERNTSGFEAADIPDEKEAEFLRSLGWDENNDEDEALTEEEIKAFVEQYKMLIPSLPQKLAIIQEAREDLA